MNQPPLVALTMGDPAGVGPEVCLRALAAAQDFPGDLVVFGEAEILRRCAARIGLDFAPTLLGREALPKRSGKDPFVVDLEAVDADAVVPGVIGPHTGAASFAYVNAAIDAALAGDVDAIATAPLNKEAMHAAGHHFPGHTEIFASRTKAARSCMMQYSEEITCTFVTVHCGYREVPALLTQERILEVIELTAEGLQRIRGRQPNIVVLGLNPHAGEHGLFGEREEERVIIPAIEAARARGHQVEGPVPPDTAFLPWKRRQTDAFVCMYHDQGHIPVKALAFDCAVNTTLGLPIIRTSVDHGTALDIAWQGKANPGSLFAAIRLAMRLATGSGASA